MPRKFKVAEKKFKTSDIFAEIFPMYTGYEISANLVEEDTCAFLSFNNSPVEIDDLPHDEELSVKKEEEPYKNLRFKIKNKKVFRRTIQENIEIFFNNFAKKCTLRMKREKRGKKISKIGGNKIEGLARSASPSI
jgi:hypothetical protein